MALKITKRAIDVLAPRAGDKPLTLWDSEVSGFGVRARAGGAKSYILMYRTSGGRSGVQRMLTIGRHGSPWTPDTARKEAKRLLGLVANGGDPAGARAEARSAPSVSELADRFMAEHVRTKRKPSTAEQYQRLLQRTILPAIGRKKVRDVTRADIAKLHHDRHALPYHANRVVAVASAMFTLAERWGMRQDNSNPCRHIERYKEVFRERMLSGPELTRLGAALAAHKGSPYVAAAIKLLIFTGARRSEVLGLRWDHVDMDRGEARLPDSKTGIKTLHFPPPALEVLAPLPRLHSDPHVIVGGKLGARLVNIQKPWIAIRKEARLSNVRLHDLRHAFASVAAASGLGLPIIGKMLGHTQAATTSRYAHLASDPVKTAAATVAATIAAAMKSTG